MEARHSLRLELLLCHTFLQSALSLPSSPGISNEAQFVFTIQSIVMAQKLKGTLSFIAKVCGA